MSLRKLAGLATLLTMANATAQERSPRFESIDIASAPLSVTRIWTDSTGAYSIEASLLSWSGTEVKLLRPNGKRVAIDLDKLSKSDVDFLASLLGGISTQDASVDDSSMLTIAEPAPIAEPTSAAGPTSLAESNPSSGGNLNEPAAAVIEPLQLPNATAIAPDGSPLETVSAMRSDIKLSRLPRLSADAAPQQVSIPQCTVSLDRFDGWAECSRPILMMTDASPQIAISITRGLILGTSDSHNQITLIDPATSTQSTIWEGNKRITLLDHHLPSGLTLLLSDHNGIGEGGQLELTKLTREQLQSSADVPSNGLRTFARHELPDNGKQRTKSKVRWARLIDDEHAMAVIDESLGCWNLVSGACLYRFDKIDSRVEPVLSPGMRYMVLPASGELRWYSTVDGKPLGRLEVDRNLTPNVAFAPGGDNLAIVSGKRLRVWDLVRAKMIDELENRRTLGTSSPVWLDSDLVMSSNGIVMSRKRKQPVWQYDVIGDTVATLGDRVALVRKYKNAELALMNLPHDAAANAIANMGSVDSAEMVATKSKWRDGSWTE